MSGIEVEAEKTPTLRHSSGQAFSRKGRARNGAPYSIVANVLVAP